MRRPGEVTIRRHGLPKAIAAWAAIPAILLGATVSAASPRLMNVRSAAREGWLRIVFDLSEPVSYRVLIRPGRDGLKEVALELAGVSTAELPERVALAGSHRGVLKLEHREGRLIASVPLPYPVTRYRHFQLTNPHRVVLDMAVSPNASPKGLDLGLGPILLSPVRTARTADERRGTEKAVSSGERVLLVRTATVVLSPPMQEERMLPVRRGSPDREPSAPPAPFDHRKDAVQIAEGWQPFFERPPIPEAREGEAGMAEFQEAVRLYRERPSPEAAEAFAGFVRAFPKSRLASAAAFLAGDSLFEGIPTREDELALPDEDTPANGSKKEVIRRRWTGQAAEAYRKALRAYAKTEWTPWGLLQLGRSESGLGFYFRAETTFQQLIDEYPGHPLAALALVHQGFNNLKLGDADLAKEIFRRVLKLPQVNPHAQALARYGLGGAHFQLEKVDMAKAEFEKARRMAPTLAKYNPDILFLMGETYLSSGDYGRARNAFTTQVNLFPDSENLPFVFTRIAETYFLEKDLNRAVVKFSEVIEKFPGTESSTVSLIRLADLAVEQPGFVKTLRNIKIPALEDPLEAYRQVGSLGKPRALAELAWLRLGEELLRRKEFKEAVRTLRILADDYKDGKLYGRAIFELEEALVGLIGEEYEKQEYFNVLQLFHAEAKRGLKGLVKIRPLIQVAGSYQELGLFEKAKEVLERMDLSEVTEDEREDIHILRIESLLAQGRWKLLEPQLKAYLKKYPAGKIRVKVSRSLAEVLVRGERWDEAEAFLKRAALEVSEGVERARMEHLLGRVYTHGERYAMAVDSLRRALKMAAKEKSPQPFLADAYYLLGENLIALGQFQQAAAVLKEGAARFPKDALRGWALYEAGSALRHVGQVEKAEKTFEEITAGKSTAFWRRMAKAMQEDIDWWQKHKQLQN